MVSHNVEVRYDHDADAAYIYVVPRGPGRSVVRTKFCDVAWEGSAISVDLDDSDALLGIEILGASKILPQALLVESQPEWPE
jgi:uncharacterized protein YuzE